MVPLACLNGHCRAGRPLQVSTSPSNGDLNPYGLINVPSGFPAGSIRNGQLLVSNFNNSENTQGKGRTIIAVDPNSGKTSLFFEGHVGTPLGFSNALTVARAGFVFAGSVPTSDAAGTMRGIRCAARPRQPRPSRNSAFADGQDQWTVGDGD